MVAEGQEQEEHFRHAVIRNYRIFTPSLVYHYIPKITPKQGHQHIFGLIFRPTQGTHISISLFQKVGSRLIFDLGRPHRQTDKQTDRQTDRRTDRQYLKLEGRHGQNCPATWSTVGEDYICCQEYWTHGIANSTPNLDCFVDRILR